VGLVRALRAELAPVQCADVLVTDFFERHHERLDTGVEETLVALALAGRLSRLVRKAPALEPPFDKAAFSRYFEDQLKPWVLQQAQAIFDISSRGAKLSDYAMGIVAIEAGMADMRFVEVARDIPLPKEFSEDPEIKDVYYAALDEALEPRKARGRDAALVGLSRFADLGAIEDARVIRARALLSKLYGGRRVDALDQLLLLDPTLSEPSTVDQRLAASLPTYYSGWILGDVALDDPALLVQLFKRGVPPALRSALNERQLSLEVARAYARASFRLGRLYWRAADFERGERVLAKARAAGELDPASALLSATAHALKGGPRDATQMMQLGFPKGAGDTTELDALAAKQGDTAGPAAFNAAYIMALEPGQNADSWTEISKRFSGAATRLEDPKWKANAKARASDAAQLAKQLAEQ
jgi:hypothetical protein